MGCLRVILLNLLRVRTVDARLTVGIFSGKGRLYLEKRYLPNFITVHYHPTALRLLQARGLVLMVKAGHQQEDWGETDRYRLTDEASALLHIPSLSARDFTISRRNEVIRLKDNEGRLTPLQRHARDIDHARQSAALE